MSARRGLQLGVHVGQQNAEMGELIELWQRLDERVDWISIQDHGADMVNVALRLPVDQDALDAYLDVVVTAARAAIT